MTKVMCETDELDGGTVWVVARIPLPRRLFGPEPTLGGQPETE